MHYAWTGVCFDLHGKKLFTAQCLLDETATKCVTYKASE